MILLPFGDDDVAATENALRIQKGKRKEKHWEKRKD
jgi:hypothetical protein